MGEAKQTKKGRRPKRTHLGLRPHLDARLRCIVDCSRNDETEGAFGASIDLKFVDVDRESDVGDSLQVDMHQ